MQTEALTKKNQVVAYFVNNSEPQTYNSIRNYFILLSWDKPGQVPTYMSYVSRLIRSGAVVKAKNPKHPKQTILMTSNDFRLNNLTFLD